MSLCYKSISLDFALHHIIGDIGTGDNGSLSWDRVLVIMFCFLFCELFFSSLLMVFLPFTQKHYTEIYSPSKNLGKCKDLHRTGCSIMYPILLYTLIIHFRQLHDFHYIRSQTKTILLLFMFLINWCYIENKVSIGVAFPSILWPADSTFLDGYGFMTSIYLLCLCLMLSSFVCWVVANILSKKINATCEKI